MSQLNLFQHYLQEQQFRSLLTLTPGLNAILDYCEYSIRCDFNAKDKQKIKNKNRKKEISEEFVKAFISMDRDEKVQYYLRVIGYLRRFSKEDYQPPKSPYSGILNDVGYSRSFSIKRWKQKMLRLDQDKHIMFAERQVKIKLYELKDYLLRLSKKKDYFTFVLEAINNNPHQKSRTVHIGFNDKAVFQKWFKSIKFSVEYREWELYCFLYRGKTKKDKTVQEGKYMNKSFYSQSNLQTSQLARKKQQEELQDMLSKSMYLQSDKRVEIDFSINKQNIFRQKDKVIEPFSNNFMQQVEKKEKSKEQRQLQQLQKQIKHYEEKEGGGNMGKTLVDELIEGQIFEEPDVFQDKIEEEDEKSKQVKKHLDLFHKMHPEYELDQLELFLNYSVIHEQPNLRIYQNQVLQKRLKMTVTFEREKHSIEQIVSMISKVQCLKSLNDNIQQIQVKTNIPSQNSALIYMVLKPFNRLYRARDFIFIRHVFKSGKQVYMIDKSIENTNYPPFMTLVRGQLCIVYGIFERGDKYQLIVDVQITNQGYLNLVQETNLTLKYLKSFNKLPIAEMEENGYKFFSLDWDINKNEANKVQDEIRTRRKTIQAISKKISNQQESKTPNFTKKNPQRQEIQASRYQQDQKKQRLSQNSEEPYKKNHNVETKSFSPSPNVVRQYSPSPVRKVEIKKFDKNTMEEVGEISVEQANKKSLNLRTDLSVVRQLDKQGLVIIDKAFMKHKYVIEPIQKSKASLRFMDTSQGHPIWKNDWIHDDKEGAIIFINKKKIEDQKGVLKFILSKMAKNLISGQSILSISLPVDIFGAESNLQRFVYSMLYGPLLLEGMEKQNVINKLIRTVVFGITNSVLYLSMEKPFNPILGETFQCWINGCPAYAQQISHHPPIGALMLKGRGYTVTAQLQSKISVGVNTGTGTNDGIYRIKFADNSEVCFITAGGEVSGLAHGDRKFNIVGKFYAWITNTNVMVEIAFDPFKKGFFSVGKSEQPSDYFQGTIWEVKPEFMAKFINGKRKQPEEKDRVKSYGKISGIWNKYMKYNNEQIFNFEKQLPLTLQFQPNPLPSDANWREDIEYRKRNEVTRAQTEKQRLQILQRKDRKLRQKYKKKK